MLTQEEDAQYSTQCVRRYFGFTGRGEANTLVRAKVEARCTIGVQQPRQPWPIVYTWLLALASRCSTIGVACVGGTASS